MSSIFIIALLICIHEGGDLVLKELNQVIEYIEDHLTEDLSLESIAQYAGVSDYHFRTVFFHLSGIRIY